MEPRVINICSAFKNGIYMENMEAAIEKKGIEAMNC